MSKQKKYRQRRLYRRMRSNDGEHFAVVRCRGSDTINFWHRIDETTKLYTFIRPKELPTQPRLWNDELCRQILEELGKPKPSLEVVRFAINGKVYLNLMGEEGENIPKIPPASKIPDGWEVHLKRLAEKNELEIQNKNEREFCETAGLAPYILRGKFAECQKEYSWRLYPDETDLQNIIPGDQVLVWTQQGVGTVTVLRIEENSCQEQPTARVLKKVQPEQKGE